MADPRTPPNVENPVAASPIETVDVRYHVDEADLPRTAVMELVTSPPMLGLIVAGPVGLGLYLATGSRVAGFMIFAPVGVAFIVFLTWRRTVQSVAALGEDRQRIRVVLDDEHLVVADDQSRHELAWSRFTHFKETRYAFGLVLTGAGTGPVIPKKPLRAYEVEAVRRALRHRLPSRPGRPGRRGVHRNLALGLLLLASVWAIYRIFGANAS